MRCKFLVSTPDTMSGCFWEGEDSLPVPGPARISPGHKGEVQVVSREQ